MRLNRIRSALVIVGAVTMLTGCLATGRQNRSAGIDVGDQNVGVLVQPVPTLEPPEGAGDTIPAPDSYSVTFEVYGADREPVAGGRFRVEDVDEWRVEFETDDAGRAMTTLRYDKPSAFPVWEMFAVGPGGATKWIPILGGGAFRRNDAKTGYRVVVRAIQKPISSGVSPSPSPAPSSVPASLLLPFGMTPDQTIRWIKMQIQAAHRAGDRERLSTYGALLVSYTSLQEGMQ